MALAPNTIVAGTNVAPYLAIMDGVDVRPHLPIAAADFPVFTVNAADFTTDATLLALASGSTPYVNIYNTVDWSKITNPGTLPAGYGNWCAFSPDATKLAVAHATSPYVSIYNTSDWSKITNPSTLPTGIGNGCAFSPDNSKLAVAHSTTPFVTIYNAADWTKITNPATLPTGNAQNCAFSPDGTKLAVAHVTSPYITVYNTSDWSKITNPSTLPTSTAYSCKFSPDGTKLAVGGSGSTGVIVYNVADWTTVTLDALTIKYGSLGVKAVAWKSNSILLVSSSTSMPGIYHLDVTTGKVIDSNDYPQNVYCLRSLPETVWEINGTISESFVAANWTAIARDYASGEVLSSADFTGTTFSLPVARPDPVIVTVTADQGSMWEASVPVLVGDKCYPTNPVSTPYYYECTVAGTTGVSEPVFPTSAGTVGDGGATWSFVEGLIEPVTQGPLIPTVV